MKDDMDKIKELLPKGGFKKNLEEGRYTEEQIKNLLEIEKLLEDFLLWEKNRQDSKIQTKQAEE